MDQSDFVQVSDIPDDHRYHQYQNMANTDGVPSQRIIEQHIREQGRDYRVETSGEHPVERFRKREEVLR